MESIFDLKIRLGCNPNLSTIEHIWEYKYYWKSKTFKMVSLKRKSSLSNQTDSNLFKYGWTQNKTKILNINVWTIAGFKECKGESNENKGNQN